MSALLSEQFQIWIMLTISNLHCYNIILRNISHKKKILEMSKI